MVTYVGVDTFFALRDNYKALMAELYAARSYEEVYAARERFGQRMGPSVARVIVMVASFALGGQFAKLPPPKSSPNNFGGQDYFDPTGWGARFNQDGSFRGFLEPPTHE